jgi:hypothetical protein
VSYEWRAATVVRCAILSWHLRGDANESLSYGCSLGRDLNRGHSRTVSMFMPRRVVLTPLYLSSRTGNPSVKKHAKSLSDRDQVTNVHWRFILQWDEPINKTATAADIAKLAGEFQTLIIAWHQVVSGHGENMSVDKKVTSLRVLKVIHGACLGVLFQEWYKNCPVF